MKNKNRLRRLLASIALLASVLLNAGCAAQYYEYADCTAYNHCPLPPLPYTTYDGCPTPLAERYAQRHGTLTPTEPTPPSDDPTPDDR